MTSRPLGRRAGGLLLVAGLELRRLRGRRPLLLLTLWAAVLLVIALLEVAPVRFGLVTDSTEEAWETAVAGLGTTAVSLVMILTLAAILVLVTRWSASALPRDREEGMLDPLRASLLRPAEIVGGKVLGVWAGALALVLAAVPALVPGALVAGIGPGSLLAMGAMLAAVGLAIAMLGVGIGALVVRRGRAVGITGLVVAVVTAGLPALWLASFPVLTQRVPVQITSPEAVDSRSVVLSAETGEELARVALPGDESLGLDPSEIMVCIPRTVALEIPRSDVLIGLAAPSPLVLLAEVSPTTAGTGPLEAIRDGYRLAADPADPARFRLCDPGVDVPPDPSAAGSAGVAPGWPVGLSLWLLGGAVVAVLGAARLAPSRPAPAFPTHPGDVR